MDNTEHSTFEPDLVDIDVVTTYLPKHSNPEEGHYTFAYTITISNKGDRAVQLLSRHWIITDSDNQVQEVQGEGVVGEQPVIGPGEHFRYTSGTTMETPVGFMEGSYTMVVVAPGEAQQGFKVAIPAFSLHLPNAVH